MSVHATPAVVTPTAILPASHDPEQMAIATFLAKYKGHTLANYTRDLRDYMAFCRRQGVGMLAVERGHLELFIREMEAKGYAQATVSRKFNTVYLFLDYAEIDDRIPKNPARKVARPKIDREAQKRSWLELGEVHAIMTAARQNITRIEKVIAGGEIRKDRADRPGQWLVRAQQDYTILQLLASTGMRVGELCSLNIDSLHVESGAAYLQYVRKGGKLTRDDLTMETMLVLLKHIERTGRQSGPLFTSGYGNRLNRANVQALITRYCKQVGIERPISPHAFRRTYVSTALLLGASMTEVQHSVHHADQKTTALYDRRTARRGMVARQLVAGVLAS